MVWCMTKRTSGYNATQWQNFSGCSDCRLRVWALLTLSIPIPKATVATTTCIDPFNHFLCTSVRRSAARLAWYGRAWMSEIQISFYETGLCLYHTFTVIMAREYCDKINQIAVKEPPKVVTACTVMDPRVLKWKSYLWLLVLPLDPRHLLWRMCK